MLVSAQTDLSLLLTQNISGVSECEMLYAHVFRVNFTDAALLSPYNPPPTTPCHIAMLSPPGIYTGCNRFFSHLNHCFSGFCSDPVFFLATRNSFWILGNRSAKTFQGFSLHVYGFQIVKIAFKKYVMPIHHIIITTFTPGTENRPRNSASITRRCSKNLRDHKKVV